MIKDFAIPKIEKAFPHEKNTMLRDIFAYIDRYHEILKTPELTYRPSFSDTDREVIYKACGVSEDEIEAEIKKSVDIDDTRNVSGNPFYVICTLLTGYCLQKKDEDTAKAIIIYMSINMYTSLHYKYVEHNANEAAMKYTISQLNNSFDIKKLGTLLELIRDNTNTVLDTYKKDLLELKDIRVGFFINAVHTRLNIKMKKIFRQYYKYKDSGMYLNMDTESLVPEEYRTISNDYHIIDSLTGKIYLNFVNNRINNEIIKLAIISTGVSEVKMKTLIQDIRMNAEDRDLKLLISSLISYAVYYNKMSIQYLSTGKYLSLMEAGYTSNTNATEMLNIKRILDEWVTENSHRYGRSNYGKTAANGYKKALYRFFVYNIYSEAK